MKKPPSIAKITRPKLAGTIPRTRLYRLLDSGRARPVTWVSAPAGSGKTTLVASWLDSRRLPCIWYQVDEGDSDIATFFYYLGLAAKKAMPRYRTPLPLLTPEYLMGLPTFTKRFFEILYSRMKLPFALVFDNYQDVPIDSGFHEVMREGLSVIPEGIRVVVVSRSEPPPALARFLASDKMSAIGWNDIRFTLEETKTLIGNRTKKNISDTLVKRLHDSTDGWASGLVLMMSRAEHAPADPEPEGALLTEKVFDYFAGEVLDKLDIETRDFLLMASFLPRMTPETTAKLTDNDHSGKILANLRRSHFFTEQHAAAEAVYQFHPLFRSFLLTRMKGSLSREGVLRVQKRAAALLVETGQIEDAVALLLETADWESVIQLILGHAQALVAQGRSKTLEAWLNCIPREIVDATPWLLFWLGICRMPYNPAQSRNVLDRAFHLFDAQMDKAGSLLCCSAAIDATIYEWNNFTILDDWIVQLEKHFQSGEACTSLEIEARVTMSMASALMIRQPQRRDIDGWVDRSVALADRIPDVNLRIQAYTFAGNYCFWIGDQDRGRIILEKIHALAHSPEASPLLKLTWKWMEGCLDVWSATSPGRALESRVSKAVEYADATGVHIWDHMLYSMGVYGALLQNGGTNARCYLAKINRLLDGSRRHVECHYHYLSAWNSLLEEQYNLADEHSETALSLAHETGYLFPIILCMFERAQILHKQERYREAETAIARAYKLSLETKSEIFQFMCLLTKARLALHDDAKSVEGLKLLRDALRLGREKKYFNMPWWSDASGMKSICEKALEKGIEREYVQRLITAHKLFNEAPFRGEKSPFTSKITRPRPSGAVARRRLFTALDSGRTKRVTWVSAPAGSGKTTLITSWLDARKLPCIWYHADAGDSDIASFFYFLGLAAKKAAPRHKKPLPLLTPEYLQGIPVFTRRYFEEFFRRLKPPFVSVLDNYQDVPEGSVFHEIIDTALSIIPEGISFVVLSRTAPPSKLSGRLSGAAHIGWDDIRFTLEETEAVVKSRERKPPSEDSVKKLYQATDGWAAGVVLMMSGGETGPNAAGKTGEFKPEKIFEYFAEEVFGRLDAGTRDFLLTASFLPVMAEDAVTNLTGNDQAGKILSGLNRDHFFTERHAAADAVYQFHPLFRTFLLSTAKESFSGEELQHVRKRAAALLKETGRTEDAVALLKDAEDWDGLARLVLSVAPSMTAQGRNRTLEEWIKGMPEDTMANTPWLFYWLGVCRVPFDPAEGVANFEKAFLLSQKHKDERGTLLSWCGAVNAIFVEWNDFAPFDPFIGWYYEQAGRLAFPSIEVEAEFASSMACAMIWRQPSHPDIGKWVERALDASRKCGNPGLWLHARNHAITYYLWAGDIANALLINEELREVTLAPQVSPLALIRCKCLEAITCYCAVGSHESGLQAISEAWETAQRHGIHVWDHMIHSLGVYGSLLKGDRKAASEHLGKMKSTLRPDHSHAYCQYHYVAAWHHLVFGDLNAAHSHADLALKLALEIAGTSLYLPEIRCRLALANVLCEQRNYQDAEYQLSVAHDLAGRARSNMLEFMYRITKARLALEQENDAGGLDMLKSAMLLGRSNNFISMLWWWQPSVMTELCMRALEEGIETEYVHRLIRKNNLIPEESPVQIETWPWPVRIYTFGRFVIEVGGKTLLVSRMQQKPLLMLKALIAFGGEDVPEDRLTDALWPEAEGDLARRSFDTTLHRMRKLFGNEKAVRIQGGRLTLDPGYFWTDLVAFERLISDAGPLWSASSERKGEKKTIEAIRLYEKAAALYRGQFLPSDTRESWAAPARERVRAKFITAVIRLSWHYQAVREYDKAIEFLQEGLAIESLSEELYQGLMTCYQQTGRESEAAAVYHRCRKMLSDTLGVGPSAKTEEIYSSFRLTDK